MSAEAGGVRVWNGYGDYREYDPQDIAFVPGVWYPAAQAKAMEALAAWAEHTLTQPLAAHEGPGAEWYAEDDRLRLAALSTLPRAHGVEGGA